jgi:isochorismate pyruvate lyase
MKPPEECASIENVREGIDALDRQIVALIGERSRYVSAAARFKTSASSVRATERQKAMIEKRRIWAEEEGLTPEVIEDIYKTLISYFVNREMEDWRDTNPNSA